MMDMPHPAPWWSDLLVDPWLTGRQTPAERDDAIAANPAFRAAQAARRCELAEQGERTAARIHRWADFTARVRAHYVYEEPNP